MPTPRKKTISIAIVDDHSLFRDAISLLIKGINNSKNGYFFKVVFEAEDGDDFTKKIINSSLSIDIVILDINMPIMNGVDALKWLHTNYPEIKALMLTMHTDPTIVATCMKEGANGYLPKNVPKEKLESTLISIASKGFSYDDFITSSLIQTLIKIDYSQDDYQSKAILATKILTDREKEFLKLLGTELNYKEIAAKMQISLRTVDGYKEELFRKFEAKSRVGLVMQAIRNRIINVH